MVRAPCCEKMGLKKGPWTPDEDEILVSYIDKYGHGNWRALPKQAGLLRCGKSCRLRWINYLRPDIKRGNFTKEEEEAIFYLHEMLGNRWSAIAARLPGRTDNEIKNVWHTHLKKRVSPSQTVKDSKRKTNADAKKNQVSMQPNPSSAHQRLQDHSPIPVSPAQSYSDISSFATVESNGVGNKEECMVSSQEFPDIDDSFWSEALSMDVCSPVEDCMAISVPPPGSHIDPLDTFSPTNNDDMTFWLRLFMEAGDVQELPEIL